MSSQVFIYCDARVADAVFGTMQCPKYARSNTHTSVEGLRGYAQRHNGWTEDKIISAASNELILRDLCPAHSPLPTTLKGHPHP